MIFPVVFKSNTQPNLCRQAYELADISQRNQVVCLNGYIKFFSRYGRIFDYYREIFGYDLQFSFSPGSIRN